MLNNNKFILSLKSHTNEFDKMEDLKSSNLFVFFSPPNVQLNYKYNNLIQKIVKNELSNKFDSLIENVKNNGIEKSRENVILFQKELYKTLSAKLLDKSYQEWRSNSNESFVGFLQKNNNDDKSVLMEKILNNFSNELQILESGINQNLKNKINYFFDNSSEGENMDIQLFFYNNKSKIPSLDLTFNTRYEDTILKGGLYSLASELTNKKADYIEDPTLEEIKNDYSNRNEIDKEHLETRFNKWYNGLFSNSILPEKETLKNSLFKSFKNINIKFNKLIDNINSKVENGTVLCFFHRDIDNKKFKPSIKLEKEVKNLYRNQGILLKLNSKKRILFDNNIIKVNNDIGTNKFMNKITNDTINYVSKIKKQEPTVDTNRNNYINESVNSYIDLIKENNDITERNITERNNTDGREEKFKQKYFKYKTKYLNLKKTIH